MDSFNDVLVAAQLYCKDRLVQATYDLYIDGLTPISFENSNTIVLGVRNDFICKIIQDRYLPLLKEAFKSVLGFDVEVTLLVPERELTPGEDPEKTRDLPKGLYEYTFDNFIKGPSNQFAYAAAQAVAMNPSGAYNPLFIYGPSGLGKTHLLKAIEMEIRKSYPDYVVLYVDSVTFTNEIVAAINNKTTDQFRMKYCKVDFLMVDDVQFIAGKESTQQEFFSTFNTLYNAGKQIVLASDRPPKEIKSLEDRLRTRFEWGLTADIQPPEFETRMAIVKRKAELLNLKMPNEVAEYIANHLKRDIRQLEGAVKKLNAYWMLEGIEPCVGVAQTAIKDILNETQPVPLTVENIIGEVSRTFNVDAADMRGAKRTAAVSNARSAAMYCIREVTGMSMENIGSEFGRDHSTVVYALKKIEKELQNDQHLREMVDDIIKNVRK